MNNSFKKSNFTSKRNALIYCRVSTKRQAEERYGIETQENMCREWCERNKVNIYKIIRDSGVSGSTFDRDWFDEVLEILDKQKKKIEKLENKHSNWETRETLFNENQPFITDFVCVDGSRISRNDNMEETIIMTKNIRSSGAEIVYVLYPVDTTTSVGMFQENLLQAFASFERRNTRMKAISWMKARLLDGYRPFGVPPIGYKREKQGKNSILTIHETKWPILKEALEMYADCILESEGAVFRHMKDKGIQSNNNQNKKGVLHKSILETIFTKNRLLFMAGFIYFPEWEIETLIPAKHEALISMQTVEKILNKQKISHQSWRIHYLSNPEFPLKDFIYCGNCERRLTGYWAKWRSKKYPYYGCANPSDPQRFQVNRDLLTKQFDDLLDTITINNDTRNLMHEVLKRLRENRKNFEGKLEIEKQAAILKIDQEMKKMRRTMLTTENIHLNQELEKEREILRVQKEHMEEQIRKKESISEESLNELLLRAKSVFLTPKVVREMSNTELKRMFMQILFWGKLYYTKKNGLRTTWESLFHTVLSATQNPSFFLYPQNQK